MIYHNSKTGAIVAIRADGTVQGGPVPCEVIEAMCRGKDVPDWINNRDAKRFAADLILREAGRYIATVKAQTGHAPHAGHVLDYLERFTETGVLSYGT